MFHSITCTPVFLVLRPASSLFFVPIMASTFVTGPDFPFDVIVIALELLQELAIGVSGSCLRVLPRFFQHIGPKLPRRFCHEWADVRCRRVFRGLSYFRFKPSVGDNSTSKKQATLGGNTAPANQICSDTSQYYTIGMYEPLRFEQEMSSKALPPTPIFEIAQRYRDLRFEPWGSKTLQLPLCGSD